MPPFKCHRLLKRNISKPEFLVFSPKPTLPSFLQLSWGRVNTSSCSHQKSWLLTLSLLQSYSICQKSCWLNLQNLYRILESLHFIATIVLQAVVSSYLHHRSSLRSPLLLFFFPYNLVSKKQPAVIYLKTQVRLYHSPTLKLLLAPLFTQKNKPSQQLTRTRSYTHPNLYDGISYYFLLAPSLSPTDLSLLSQEHIKHSSPLGLCTACSHSWGGFSIRYSGS